MSDNITNIVTSLLDGIHGIAKSETIVGEPQQAGEASIIPVHRLKIAFGVGNAKAGAESDRLGGDSGGMAAGGMVQLDPVAAITVGKDGTPRILTVEADESFVAQLMQEMPDILTRVLGAVGDRVGQEVRTRAERALKRSNAAEEEDAEEEEPAEG
jgi:uncharacterized spore protein YtfJ